MVILIVHANKKVFSYHTKIIENIDQVPTSSTALIFGAGVKRDGTPSDVLKDRVDTGVELYEAHKVQKLVMTGDNGTNKYNEVVPMKARAIEKGVPEEDIVLDYAGFDTYDSCYRARDIFGLTTTIAISQEFHLPRVLFTCNELGVHAIGLEADKHVYVARRWWKTREFLARVKAWYEVEVRHPKPKFLGKKEKVF